MCAADKSFALFGIVVKRPPCRNFPRRIEICRVTARYLSINVVPSEGRHAMAGGGKYRLYIKQKPILMQSLY